MLGLGSSLVTGGAPEEWTPLKLGSTLDLWYQYNTGITSDGGSPDLVSQWDDQSGNSRHAQQDTDGLKPSVTGGALDFDDTSTSDYLTLATGDGAIDYTSDGSGTSQPFTLTVALRKDANDDTDRFIGGDSSEFMGITNSGDRVHIRGSGTLLAIIFEDDDAGAVQFPGSQDIVITITRDTSMFIRVYKNGDILTLDSSTTGYDASNPTKVAMANNSTSMSLQRIGAGAALDSIKAFDGKMYELIVCDTLLSDSDRNLAINYVKDKLGI